MVKLSEKEINDINTYFFSIYDKKNKGGIKIDNKENIFLHDALLNSLYYLGIKMKENEINELIKENGFEKDGIIYFEEFIEILKKKLDTVISKDEIEEYFNILSDGEEYILQSDFHKILENNNDFDNVLQLISEIGSENGKIYYYHFCKIFN
jgi:Ca2+-binding EF-hand superfamily protein